MKLFAFSDWRTQSVDDLKRAVKQVSPDAVLYAGDDLERVIPFEAEIFLKTKHSLIPFSKETISSDRLFDPRSAADFLAVLESVRRKIQELGLSNEALFGDVPFFFVNGNDDAFLKVRKEFYHRVHGPQVRIWDKQGSRLLYALESAGKKILLKHSEDRLLFRREVSNEGFYLKYKVQPHFGHFTFRGLRIFGYQCKHGLESAVCNRPTKKVDVFLSHLPPLGQLDLSARFGVRHIGSRQVLADLKCFKPKYVICGHSHLWGGKNSSINGTTVLNTSSHDNFYSSGNYVVIDTERNSFRSQSIEFKSICQIRGGWAALSELKRERFDHDAVDVLSRINLLSQMATFTRLAKQKRLAISERVKGRLLSLNWKRPKIVAKLSYNPEKCVYLDVETGLANGGEPGKLWLIGVLCGDELKQFKFPSERKLFQSFLALHKEKPIVSWTDYDQKAICRSFKVTNRWIDACKRVGNCVVWHTYHLSELYSALFGLNESHPVGGVFIGILADHRIHRVSRCAFCPKKEEIMATAIEKNKNDLLQMREISRLLWDGKRILKN